MAANAEGRADALSLMADYVMRRGDLDGAERIAREAEALIPGMKRMPWTILSSIAMHRGRLEQAIPLAERAFTVSESHVVATNRGATAGLQMYMAILYAELGRGDVAIDFLRKAEPEFAGDRKRGVIIGVAAARVHALRGERELAIERIESAVEGARNISSDIATQRSVFYHGGRAALDIDDTDRAQILLDRYRELNPDPVFEPGLYYHLAECRRKLLDSDGEREFLIKAAAFQFGTQWEGRARERLAALGPMTA